MFLLAAVHAAGVEAAEVEDLPGWLSTLVKGREANVGGVTNALLAGLMNR